MKYSLISLVVLSATSVCAQNFSPNLSTGKIPSTMKAEDRDGAPIATTCYKNGKTDAGWTVSSVGTTGNAFISPSHTHESVIQNNWLTINPLTVEKGAIIRWNARSVYSDFPDTYRVVARVEGETNYSTLFEGTAEDVMTPHSVSLSAFAGKSTEISFVCDSENGYLLAIGDIFVGVPTEPIVSAVDLTDRFVGKTDKIPVKGTLTNVGSDVRVGKITLTIGNQEVASSNQVIEIPNGETVSFEIGLPANFNEKTDYTLQVFDQQNNKLTQLSGSAMSSWFPRTHFVDEGTGTWCNNCPEGIVNIHKMHRDYPDQMVVASIHTGYDPMSNDAYWPGLKFYAVPYFMLNHNQATKYSSLTNFKEGLWEPTKVSLKLRKQDSDLLITLNSAENLDNSSDRYRLGYIFTSNFYQEETDIDYVQHNSLTFSRWEEFYFLPSLISTHLVKFHDVNLDGDGYFDGIPNSIPAEIKADQPNECITLYPNVPDEEYTMWSGHRAIVYVIDTETGHIMNTAAVYLDGSDDDVNSSVEEVAEGTLKITLSEGLLTVNTISPARVEIFSLTGSSLWKGVCDKSLRLPGLGGSPVIVRVVTDSESSAIKTIL